MAVTVMTKNRGKPLVTGLVGVSTITYKRRHTYVLITELVRNWKMKWIHPEIAFIWDLKIHLSVMLPFKADEILVIGYLLFLWVYLYQQYFVYSCIMSLPVEYHAKTFLVLHVHDRSWKLETLHRQVGRWLCKTIPTQHCHSNVWEHKIYSEAT